MSGVVISEAIVAIENRAKYVFKVITSLADGRQDTYLAILKNPVKSCLTSTTSIELRQQICL